MYSMEEMIEAELEARKRLQDLCIEILKNDFAVGKGHVGRGLLQDHIYRKLGFECEAGNFFQRYLNRLLRERGFRVGWFQGRRVVYGLQIRDEDGTVHSSFKSQTWEKKKKAKKLIEEMKKAANPGEGSAAP